MLRSPFEIKPSNRGHPIIMLDLNLNASQELCKNRSNVEKVKIKAKSLGDWDGRIVAADSDPKLMSNPDYWNAYCQGMYQRYLKKYRIDPINFSD